MPSTFQRRPFTVPLVLAVALLAFEATTSLPASAAGWSTYGVSNAVQTDGPVATAVIHPEHLVANEAGDLFFSEGQFIRELTHDGVVRTLAGEAFELRPQGPSPVLVDDVRVTLDGQELDHRPVGKPKVFFGETTGLARDAGGNLYFSTSQTVYRLQPGGQPEVWAGGASAVQADRDGLVSAASFHEISAIASANDGTMYVAEQNLHKIRRISSDGQVSTVRPSAPKAFENVLGVAVGADNTLYWMDGDTHAVRALAPDGQSRLVAGGPDANSTLEGATGFTQGGDGSFIVTTGYSDVFRISPGGAVTKLLAAGAVDADSPVEFFSATCDAAGTVYRPLSTGQILRGRKGAPADWLGTGYQSTEGDAHHALLAPTALAFDGADLAVLETDRIRLIDPAGALRTLVAPEHAPFRHDSGLLSKHLLVARSGRDVAVTWRHQIQRWQAGDPMAALLAGTDDDKQVDGDAAHAQFGDFEAFVGVGDDGYFVVDDADVACLRKVTNDGKVATVGHIDRFPGIESAPSGKVFARQLSYAGHDRAYLAVVAPFKGKDQQYIYTLDAAGVPRLIATSDPECPGRAGCLLVPGLEAAQAMAIDAQGRLFVTTPLGKTLYVISPSGVTEKIALPESVILVKAIAVNDQRVAIASSHQVFTLPLSK